MTIRRGLILVLLALGACVSRPESTEAPPPQVPLILISIDGLQPGSLGQGDTPVMDAMAAGGVRAESMRPSFPSLTFPNHYTLVTGLRPDKHGIVNNTIEDPEIAGVRFTLSNRAAVEDSRWWNGAEPIWVTAEKAGIATATMFWPGSEAEIRGRRPTSWLSFDGKLPNTARVAQILAWLDAPLRPGFLTLYFDTVDHDGHEFGPGMPETRRAIADVDAHIGDLLAGLKARGVQANIVIVSDHGMAAVSPERQIRLDLLLPADSFRTITGGAVAGLEAMPGQAATLEAALLKPHDHMQCWPKAQVPARLHYGRNPRVPAYVCMATPGWMIWGMPPKADVRLGGMHGYDPATPDMAATFIASGPAFRSGVVLPPFDNVDVHPLLLRLLDLPPMATDGRDRTLRGTLRR